MPAYLTILDVIAINERMIAQYGGSLGMRDEGALESALMRPQMAAHYEEADLISQASVLIAGIALAHAFVDGNKRTALVVGVAFLDLNGLRVQGQPEELGRQIELLVTRPDTLDDAMARFEGWLRDHTRARTEDSAS